MSLLRRRPLLAACLLLPALRLAAQDRGAEKTTLLVAGKLAPAYAAGARIPLSALQALPQLSFTTTSPWTKKAHLYTGPLLRDVLKLLGAEGTTLRAGALNDYEISIPVADAHAYDVIVAHQIDGKDIPVRERGPLFVIYPFDQKPELQSARYYERSIWQLRSLKAE